MSWMTQCVSPPPAYPPPPHTLAHALRLCIHALVNTKVDVWMYVWTMATAESPKWSEVKWSEGVVNTQGPERVSGSRREWQCAHMPPCCTVLTLLCMSIGHYSTCPRTPSHKHTPPLLLSQPCTSSTHSAGRPAHVHVHVRVIERICAKARWPMKTDLFPGCAGSGAQWMPWCDACLHTPSLVPPCSPECIHIYIHTYIHTYILL